MNDRPTAVQARVLESIQQRLDQGAPTPTYRELCKEFGWSSTGTVRDHLKALARKGYVELSGPRHRQIRLRGEAPISAAIPVVGRVIAGVPVLAEENIEGRIPVPAAWTGRGLHFALRVSGDSMNGAGILEGDYVVVRQQPTAQDGEVVVATVDGETTLKRLRHRGKRVALVAENSRYRPIYVRTEAAVIQGVVIGLLRVCRGRRSNRRVRATKRVP
jgi:repressor LexA